MNRDKIANKMFNYLEKTVNCENIIKFADRMINGKDNKNKLIIGEIPVSFQIISYNDKLEYTQKTDKDLKDNKWIQNKFKTFDIMTESNHTGFEYFPYLYGVLNCHDSEKSKVYIFYEFFEGVLTNLINNIQHPSEWYDIIFQMIVIDYYLKTSGYNYKNATIANHLYRKLDKPYYKEYILNNIKFNINHKYLIVLNFDVDIYENDENEYQSNISLLLKYLDDNKENIKIFPSQRIIKLLTDISNNKDNDNIPIILQQYYGPNTNN